MESEESNNLFVKIFENSPAGIVISTLNEGRIIDCNPHFVEMMKYSSKEEIIGKTSLALNFYSNPDERKEVVSQIIEKGYLKNYENTMRTKQGELIWVLASINTITLNEIPSIVSVIVNISEHKLAFEQLRKSRQEIADYKHALDASSIVAITNQKGIITYVNETFCKISKYSADELIGQDHRILNSGFHSKEFIRGLWTQISRGKPWKGEIKNKAKDGTYYWVDTFIHPFMDNNGKPYKYLSIRKDITLRKYQQEQLLKQDEYLKTANEELESFSYSVSHDLKAPLRSIEGFSKSLLENYKGKFDEEADRWLHFIELNAVNMGVLINDILNFSKVSRAELHKDTVNMKKLAQEYFDIEKVNFKNIGIHFNLENIPNAYGDNAMLRQVWQNLISNALKYSSKKETIHITIGGRIENEFTIYFIKDKGAGFDEKHKDKLFGVFQRLHTNKEFEGTGVGLSIVNRIIQKHNGWIRASSKIGEGTEFIFGLPVNTN